MEERCEKALAECEERLKKIEERLDRKPIRSAVDGAASLVRRTTRRFERAASAFAKSMADG